MKFTLSWLKDHLETDADLDTILRTLTAVGLEVEGVEDRAKALEGFVVAHVVEAKPHPDADRLRACVVDNGRERLSVVCGAPNARAGMKAVLAPVGAVIPAGKFALKATKIRGVESNGMLCSAAELEISDDHEGIIDLPADLPVGMPAAEALGLADPVIEIAITPNRADCLGVRGVARDLAAAGLGRLKDKPAQAVAGRFESPVKVRFDFPAGAENACPLFVGRTIRGVRNGPSPKWLQDRLRAIGLRPISALVDITNLLTFDRSRPLHVFDVDKVKGGLTVRLSRPGETLTALNGKTYELDDAMTVIADEAGVEALGGIMGGEETGVTDATTTVFVEAALFDPIRTAATGRKLGILSDARYRFERGIDPAAVVDGMEAATRLILDLCGGEPSDLVIVGAEPEWRREIVLRRDRIRALGGAEVSPAEAERILRALGFGVTEHLAGMAASVPSWRGDIDGEADLVEEVLRIWGYDNIPPVSLPRMTPLPQPAIDAGQRRVGFAKRFLASRGLVEAVTFSFLSSKEADLFGGVPEALRLLNPISSDLDVMRPSLLPNLIAAAGRNADRGYGDLALFEVGPQFADSTPEGETTAATGIRVGMSGPRNWLERPRPADAFDAKGDALALLLAVGAPVDNVQVTADAPGWYHPGRSGVLRMGPKVVLGYFGEIHPRVLKAMDVKGPVVAFEVFLNAVPLPKAKAGKARPLLKLAAFQPIERDFAFLVDAGVAAEAVLKAVRQAERALIADATVFDVYQGPNLEPGKKSLAVAVRLQPTERTLTDAEIEEIAGRIVANVAKATGAVLRG